MTTLRRSLGFLAVLISAIALVEPAGALPLAGVPSIVGPADTKVVERPAINSYQPYTGLQFGFRPRPPIQRGVRTNEPRVIMPRPVAPLIEYGRSPDPYAGQFYAYCPDRFDGTMDPPGSPFSTRSPQRTCP